MIAVTYLIVRLVSSLLRLFEFFMFARAIFSWFPQARDSKVYEFLYYVTEPIIMPFRSLLNRFDAIRTIPLDISFLCAFLTLEILQILLYNL